MPPITTFCLLSISRSQLRISPPASAGLPISDWFPVRMCASQLLPANAPLASKYPRENMPL